ncbi:hypothetical protein KFK09_013395 [Dendrobium nobile]|uniref:Uncharacterized protein n=1 Tax=Dendrobium nobile TaxID=94219 RepID=A0A8T3B782_DENNO|nr:hypothetical protein KFK09_013395 [Dendrobium nobile]
MTKDSSESLTVFGGAICPNLWGHSFDQYKLINHVYLSKVDDFINILTFPFESLQSHLSSR